MTSPRTFHVIHGYSAAGTFHRALPEKSAQMLVHDDVLSCGPLPPFESAPSVGARKPPASSASQ